MSWTDERVELLKKLWADGLSASQIAAELGVSLRGAAEAGKKNARPSSSSARQNDAEGHERAPSSSP